MTFIGLITFQLSCKNFLWMKKKQAVNFQKQSKFDILKTKPKKLIRISSYSISAKVWKKLAAKSVYLTEYPTKSGQLIFKSLFKNQLDVWHSLDKAEVLDFICWISPSIWWSICDFCWCLDSFLMHVFWSKG